MDNNEILQLMHQELDICWIKIIKYFKYKNRNFYKLNEKPDLQYYSYIQPLFSSAFYCINENTKKEKIVINKKYKLTKYRIKKYIRHEVAHCITYRLYQDIKYLNHDRLFHFFDKFLGNITIFDKFKYFYKSFKKILFL